MGNLLLKHIKMGFGDVSTAAGVKALNDFLAERAYVEGFVPSQVDVAVFEAMGGKAPGADMAHALRWYNQIKSYSGAESKKFPGVKATMTTTTSICLEAPTKRRARRRRG